jgi:peptidoglycan LD-endopeptidase LytH
MIFNSFDEIIFNLKYTVKSTILETLQHVLFNNKSEYYPILGVNTHGLKYCIMDFTQYNTDLLKIDFRNTGIFTNFIFNYLKLQSNDIGIGGYAENRAIYTRSEHFKSVQEARSIHLGVDIWANANTEIYAPISGIVHSFQDNNNFGDYGPTIILEHQLDNQIFYSLYGHLSRESLKNISIGKIFTAGDLLAEIGDYPENGDWPPHLHFQLIADIGDFYGDYPGVCKPSESTYYLNNCPDPNIVLGIV